MEYLFEAECFAHGKIGEAATDDSARKLCEVHVTEKHHGQGIFTESLEGNITKVKILPTK